MNATLSLSAVFAASLLAAASLPAQRDTASTTDEPITTSLRSDSAPEAGRDSTAAPGEQGGAPSRWRTAPQITIQRLRPVDQRGINVFETPKRDAVRYTGFKLDWGAAFTQQFQNLDHRNRAAARFVAPDTVNRNLLVPIGAGFNNANANLYLNAQLAPGIRVAVTSYMSSRHHNEFWVKDGYLQVDESPFDVPVLQALMQVVTLKAGHFEINYGDAHFRRTDNGNAMYNPLVGNYLMDAFTTQIGGEVLVRRGPFLAVGAVTGGEVRGVVRNPERRAPAYIGKVGFDQSFSDNFRVRLTGSMYSQSRSANNTLYSGDRAGSRYYSVMDSLASTEAAQAWSGAMQPGFASEVRASVINPFIKIGGLELFGNFEVAKGRAAIEPARRRWTQNVYEGVYRFLGERLYVAARYNEAKGTLRDVPNEVSLVRRQLGGGWFITPNVMLKGEYVIQRYHDFPLTDIRRGGKFNGLMFEGVVAF